MNAPTIIAARPPTAPPIIGARLSEAAFCSSPPVTGELVVVGAVEGLIDGLFVGVVGERVVGMIDVGVEGDLVGMETVGVFEGRFVGAFDGVALGDELGRGIGLKVVVVGVNDGDWVGGTVPEMGEQARITRYGHSPVPAAVT